MTRYLAFCLLFLIFVPGAARADDEIILRPQGGYGVLSGESRTGVSHVGSRILLQAGGNKRYGLELSQFIPNKGNSFTTVGIVLEQKLWGWFSMGIGTVGYFNYGLAKGNPVGVVSNLGWEPDSRTAVTPFVTYRSDMIFSGGVDTAHSLSVGLSFRF